MSEYVIIVERNAAGRLHASPQAPEFEKLNAILGEHDLELKPSPQGNQGHLSRYFKLASTGGKAIDAQQNASAAAVFRKMIGLSFVEGGYISHPECPPPCAELDRRLV